MRQLSLLDPIEIQLTQDYKTVIDPIDSDLADSKWCAIAPYNYPKFYAGRSIYTTGNKTPKRLWMHRLILSRILNRPLLENEEVDHIDTDGLNNTRLNLRLATHVENARNRRMTVRNTSGYKGVSWHKNARKWVAEIGHNGEHIKLGYFDTAEEAYAAYCAAARELHGEFARFA